VTYEAIQFAVSALFSICFACYIYRLARHRLLNFRYTAGWLALCGVGIFAGFLLPILGPISKSVNVTPAAIIAVGALVVLLLICVQLSIAISNLQERTRSLAEQIAHLQLEIEPQENQNMSDGDNAR
jgi:hypothetical protein